MQYEDLSKNKVTNLVFIVALLFLLSFIFFTLKIEKTYEFNPHRFQLKEIKYLSIGSFSFNIKIGETKLGEKTQKWMLNKGVINNQEAGVWYKVYGSKPKVSFVYKDMFDYGNEDRLFDWCINNEEKAINCLTAILKLMKNGDFERASLIWEESYFE